jgi:hypothetical protein
MIKQIGIGLVSAVVGGIVSIALLANGWILSGLFDKLKYELATTIMDQLIYTPEQSESKIQHVDFSCPEGSRIVTASCIERDSQGNLQVAIATFEKNGSLSCDRYGGDGQAKVQATAICAKVKNTF